MFDVAMLASAMMALTMTGPIGATPREAPVAPPAAASEPAMAKDRQRYCVVDTITGSRLAKRECRTRSEWKNLGFDPLAAK